MDIVETVTVLGSITVGLTSVILALCQYIKTSKMKRASVFNDLIEKLRADPEIRKWIRIIDYGKDWYGEELHHSYDKEAAVDKTLQTFSYICYLRENKLIDEKEFSTIKYEIWRILGDKGVQNYMFNLYHFSSNFFHRKYPKDVETFPFNFLLSYGVSERLIRDSFFDKNSKEYNKILNF